MKDTKLSDGWKYFKNKRLSITIPAYNERGNIETVINNAVNVLSSITNNYEVLIINDGSTDGMEIILNKIMLKNKRIRVITFEKNKGIGEALYTIFDNFDADYFFVVAGDNQVHMDELYKLLPYALEYDIVVANRINRAEGFFRKIVSGIFSTIIRIRFGLPVKDIDSSKVYNAKKVFNKIKPQSHTAFIETEILIRAKSKNLKIIEVPVKHYPRVKGKSHGIKLKVIIPQLWQLFKAIFTRWK